MREHTGIFPSIIKCELSTGIISYEQKCLFHEQLLLQYLRKSVNGWALIDFLSVQNINKFVLYAITDFTEIVCDDLKHKQVYGQGRICDKRAVDFRDGYKGWEVIGVEELVNLYHTNEINKIIILSVLHENEIMDDLLNQGIKLNDLISIVSILYS